jgi:hypothetical protein
MVRAGTLGISLVMAAIVGDLAGCGGPCTDIGTAHGAVLHLDSRAAVGMYRVEVDVGAETLLLVYTTTADGQAACVSCEDTRGALSFRAAWLLSNEPVSTFLASDVTLNLRRTDETTGPAQFQLRIYRDDVLVTEEEVRPSYRTTEPRGDGCGESTSAQIDVVVP